MGRPANQGWIVTGKFAPVDPFRGRRLRSLVCDAELLSLSCTDQRSIPKSSFVVVVAAAAAAAVVEHIARALITSNNRSITSEYL